MNIRALLFLILSASTPILSTTQKPEIPLSDMVIHMDRDQLIAELKKREEWDPKLKMTYTIAGAVLGVAAITGATILVVHFNQ